MAAVTRPLPEALPVPVRIPLRQVLPYALFAGVFLLMLLYVVGLEQGATSVVGGSWIHELLHDGRHLLGFPCH